MQNTARLADRACTVGFVEMPCPRCRPGDVRCTNCDGTRRIWMDGPATLNDAGLERLLALNARILLAGRRSPFRHRHPEAIHWPPRHPGATHAYAHS